MMMSMATGYYNWKSALFIQPVLLVYCWMLSCCDCNTQIILLSMHCCEHDCVFMGQIPRVELLDNF